ncbi:MULTISPECIES: hypothetical protein [unclassified Bradyrhizobium]
MADLSPLILIVATLNLNISERINIVSQPSQNLDQCQQAGELAIKAGTQLAGSWSSYVCHDNTRQQAIMRALGVIAFVKSDGNIKISEGYKLTMEECKTMGMATVATGLFPRGSWVCYDLKDFEQAPP